MLIIQKLQSNGHKQFIILITILLTPKSISWSPFVFFAIYAVRCYLLFVKFLTKLLNKGKMNSAIYQFCLRKSFPYWPRKQTREKFTNKIAFLSFSLFWCFLGYSSLQATGLDVLDQCRGHLEFLTSQGFCIVSQK